jgi:glycerol kinase
VRYILSIDQSTSATKGFLWDETGRKIASDSLAHKQIVNSLGWIEHDAQEIYQNVLSVCHNVLQRAQIPPERVETIGLSNQRETAVCWDAVTGKPFYNAIVWQCARAADLVASLEKNGVAGMIQHKTGLPLSPYFSAAKFFWMVRNVPEAGEALKTGSLRVGTMDAWLCSKLTGRHCTDYSNASRTQLMNLDTLQWDVELLEMFGLQPDCMPEICMSDCCFGFSDIEGLLPRKIPIHGMLGDSHAALLANRCMTAGMAKVTYGTGSSVMANVGETRPAQSTGLSVSLAWGLKNKVQYVLEGNINDTGNVIKWLCEDVGILDSTKQAGEIARTVENANGVYLVPAFSGLGAPWFRNDVRAAFLGMNRTTGKAHLVRAAEECIAYQVMDVVEAMRRAMGTPLRQIHADGGPTKDTFLMQFQTDILGIPLNVSRMSECSAAGAAWCAAVAQGIVDGESAFQPQYQRLLPQISTQIRDTLYDGWKSAIQTLLCCKGDLL